MSNIICTLLWLWLVCSWFTHIIFCFAEGLWGFLIAGAILVPVAIFHGTYVWFT